MPTYRFKSFVLNTSERQLTRAGKVVPLTPKVFDTLVYLVERAGHLAEKDSIMRAVWSDSIVEEGNLSRSIHTLRRALGQDDNGNKFIETVPTKGYRFTVPVVNGDSKPADLADPGSEKTVSDPEVSEPEIQTAGVGSGTVSGGAKIPSFLRPPLLVAGVLAVFVTVGAFWYGGSSPSGATGSIGQAPSTRNSGAYRLYMEGKLILDRRYNFNGEEALVKFEEAIKLDPSFSLAYAGKADAEWRIFIRSTGMHDDIAKARASVSKALSLDPNSSYAHTVLCRVYTTYDWNFPAAEKACRRAVELDPKSHDARHELAMFLTQFARHDEALEQIDAAIAIAPTSLNKRNRAIVLFNAKRYDEGIAELEQIKASDPQSPHWSYWLWWFHAMNRDHDRAFTAYIDWRRRLGRSEVEVRIKPIYSTEGWTGVLNEIVRDPEPRDPGDIQDAAVHCQLGKMDETFEFLDAGLKKRTLWMINLMADPRFDPCREDPRFDEVLKRIGLK